MFKKIFNKRHIIILVLVTIILFLTMSIVNPQRGKVSVLEDVAGVIITPVQKFFATIGNGVSSFFGYFANVDKLNTENRSLLAQIEELNKNIRDLESLKGENERLRKMLDLKEKAQEFEIESAEIISKDPGNWYNTFTIDKGTSSGLEKKMPVITTEKALVGYISDIGTNWAKIVSIIDPDSSVGSIIVRSRDIGIVEGDMELRRSNLMKMTYISKNTNIIEGDYIETSGFGGIYPKGILIGRVKEIRPETQGVSQYASIEPAVDFERITEVFVIKNALEQE